MKWFTLCQVPAVSSLAPRYRRMSGVMYVDIRKEDVELDSHVKEDASGRRYLKVPGSEFIFSIHASMMRIED